MDMLMVLMLLLSVAFLVLLERKLLGSVQLRTSPHNVSWYGVLQTVMDSLKLLNKPSAMNNKHSFSFLILMIMLSYMCNLYMLMVMMLSSMISMFMGVILSDNIYSKMGGFRMVILTWGYDILLLVMLLLMPKMLLIMMMMYYVLSIEVGRTPIDLIEGESELVSGFNTEYSSSEFVGFFLSEYLGILVLLVMVLSVDVNLVMFLYCLSMYVRSSYPRKKYNEVVMSMWKYMVLIVMLYYLM